MTDPDSGSDCQIISDSDPTFYIVSDLDPFQRVGALGEGILAHISLQLDFGSFTDSDP